MAKNPTKGRAGSYKVGKGRPPLTTRWKPGQSGNPKGRPRGSKNLNTILAEALDEKIPVQEKGKTRLMTAREVIAKKIVLSAMKGDHKSIDYVLSNDSNAPIGKMRCPSEPASYDDSLKYGDREWNSLSRKERAERAQQAYLRLVRDD